MFRLKKLIFEDKQKIEQFTSQFEPFSDFNFTSLWSYNIANNTEIFLDDDHFIIKFPNYLTNLPTYSLLSRGASLEIIHKLFEHIESEGHPKVLTLVPEVTLSSETKRNNNFIINEDRDNFDYVLSIPDVASLEQTIYKYKRKHIHQFLKYHPTHEIKITRGTESYERQMIMSLFDTWATTKVDRDTSHEKIALSRLLTATNSIDCFIINILDQGELVGFAVIENMGVYSIGSFMKGNPSYEHVYDMLYFQCVTLLNKLGSKYLNYEQDLGMIPMREAKMHWHPSHFLKKYTLTLK